MHARVDVDADASVDIHVAMAIDVDAGFHVGLDVHACTHICIMYIHAHVYLVCHALVYLCVYTDPCSPA